MYLRIIRKTKNIFLSIKNEKDKIKHNLVIVVGARAAPVGREQRQHAESPAGLMPLLFLFLLFYFFEQQTN